MRTLEVVPSRSTVDRLHRAPAHAEARTNLPRPSWTVLIVATAVVAGVTWGIARQRTNVIDPRQVIAVNLSAAKLAVEDGRLVEPVEHSAAYYYRMVLAIDPANETARTGLDAVADELLTVAKEAILSGRFADAVDAIDHTRRIAPSHRRIPFVQTELRKALDAYAASVPPPRESAQQAHQDADPPASVGSHDPIIPLAAVPQSQVPAPRVAPVAAVPTPASPPQSTLTLQDRQYVAVDTAYRLAHSALDSAPVPVKEEPQLPPITVSAERAAPKLVSVVEPEYPKAARVRGLEGWVDLTLSVAAAGNVLDARIEDSTGTRSFERAALSAVREWRYEASASTAPQEIPVRVEFRLEK